MKHTAPIFAKHKILPITEINRFQTVQIVHKFFYKTGIIPALFITYFIKQSDLHYYQTRESNLNLHQPFHKSSLSLHTCSTEGPTEWNKLPSEIKTINIFVTI